MTQSQFNSLRLEDRATYLWDTGKFLETTTYYRHIVKLYSLHSYFVEVYYSLDLDKIEKIEIAEEIEMKKYLGGIDLNGLGD